MYRDGSVTYSAVINFSASGSSTVVGGVAGQRINIMKLALVIAAATNLTFQDASTPLTGAMSMLANGSIVLDCDGAPWYTTSVGNGFIINSSSAVQVSGSLQYQLVPG